MNAQPSTRRRVVQAIRSVCPQSVLNWREAQFWGKYGEVELHFLNLLCDPRRDSLDVGANDGAYVHFLRRYSRHVHAFEPLPELVEGLRRKFPQGVTIHPIAVSSTNGTATLHMPEDSGTLITGCSTISSQAVATYQGARHISVPIDTLDRRYSGDAGFLKIDVEGHEEGVLHGGRATIARCRPSVLIEVLERLSPGCAHRIRAYFDQLDYKGMMVFRRELVPAEEFDPARMQREEDYPDLAGDLFERERFGPFVYNVMYLPRERADMTFHAIEERIKRL